MENEDENENNNPLDGESPLDNIFNKKLNGDDNDSKTNEPTSLSDNQKLKILKIWQESKSPPSIKDLTQTIFGGIHDGRSKCSKLIKQFLATNKLEATVSYKYQKVGEVNLTEENKEFISNNFQTHTSLEMAEILFPQVNGKRLTNLSAETRIVISFVKSLNPQIRYQDPNDIATDKYKAPKIDGSMIDRINKYISEPIDKTQYDKNEKQKKWVKHLIEYINSYRFLQQVNTYEMIDDRELFESSFITFLYGKDDIEAEELHQYIILCTEIVNSKHIQENIQKFQRVVNESLDSEEGKKLSLNYVEMTCNLRKENDDCVKRQQSLMNNLKGKRSERLKGKQQNSESLVTLVEFWKNEETRKRLIEAGIIRREKLKEEVKRLEDMDALKFEIFGVDSNEIINS